MRHRARPDRCDTARPKLVARDTPVSADRVLARLELPASRPETLRRIEDAGLIAQGRVFLLSLEPIEAELGVRWHARQDMVWDAIEKALVKRMPPPDVFLRLSPTTVLAAVASVDSYDGQVLCADVLRSILTFFLGRSLDDDLGISRVSSLGDDGLTAEPVNLSAPRPKSVEASQAVPTRSYGNTAGLEAMNRPQISGLQSEHHGTLMINHRIVPVWRLEQHLIGAYALSETLSVRADLLSDSDREKVALAAMASVMPLLENFRDGGGALALFLPCAFSVISARRPRLALLSQCARVSDIMRRAVILQIGGIHAGAPSGLIRETMAMIKPFVHALTVEVADNAETQTAFREAAFNGLAINGSGLTKAQLEIVIRSGRRRTPNIMVRDAPTTLDPEWLRACGASHVSWIPSSNQPPL